jgi:hypothetical protein
VDDAVGLLAWLMDEAFEGVGLEGSGDSQSLLGNLRTVTPEQWRARALGEQRTIESIALHVGACKVVYADFAFRGGTLTFTSPEAAPWPPGTAPMESVMLWLRQAHVDLMRHVRGLVSADLGALRPANWGELRETRWLLSTLLQHDTYHAGEINRMRSRMAGEDRWTWQIHAGIPSDPEA